MPKTYRTTLGLLAVGALAVSGCAGGSGKPQSSTHATSTTAADVGTTSPLPLTRSQFVAIADLSCARINAMRISNKVRTPQDLVRTTHQLAALEFLSLQELRRYAPPASLASDWAEIESDMKTIAENTAKIGEYTQVGNIKGTTGFYKASTFAQERLTLIARRDGFKDCAE